MRTVEGSASARTRTDPRASARAQLVHRRDHRRDVLGLHVRRHTVAEIEDVAFARAAIAVDAASSILPLEAIPGLLTELSQRKH